METLAKIVHIAQCIILQSMGEVKLAHFQHLIRNYMLTNINLLFLNIYFLILHWLPTISFLQSTGPLISHGVRVVPRLSIPHEVKAHTGAGILIAIMAFLFVMWPNPTPWWWCGLLHHPWYRRVPILDMLLQGLLYWFEHIQPHPCPTVPVQRSNLCHSHGVPGHHRGRSHYNLPPSQMCLYMPCFSHPSHLALPTSWATDQFLVICVTVWALFLCITELQTSVWIFPELPPPERQ